LPKRPGLRPGALGSAALVKRCMDWL
jgi:hypothetical protein